MNKKKQKNFNYAGAADLASQKAALRTIALTRRNACNPALGADLAKHVLRDCMPKPGAIVAGFWPLAGEIDIRPLLHTLAIVGYDIVLPVTPKRGEPLTFRKWNIDDALLTGRYGTKHPEGPELTPDFILVPLLAFDATGNRLGHGAGYYDRTLSALPQAFRLGCAFSEQEFEKIPTWPEDMKLHAVATELGVRWF